MPRTSLALVAALCLAGACRNPCQRVCVQMKLFAEDCGYTVPDAELDACLDEQADATGDDKGLCRDAGDVDVIEQRWDCETIAEYWGAPAE